MRSTYYKFTALFILILISCSEAKKNYYENGTLKERFFIDKNGEKDGIYESFFKNGQKKETIFFEHGKKNRFFLFLTKKEN